MPAFRMDIGSVSVTVASLKAIGDFNQLRVLESGGKELLEEIRADSSLTDHTQSDLDRLGNPYAKKWPSIREAALGHDGHMIHKQSGRGLRALRGVARQSPTRYRVGFELRKARYMAAVLAGNDVMHGRDTLWVVAQDINTRRLIMRAVVRVLGKELRTQAAIRFEVAGRSGPPQNASV